MEWMGISGLQNWQEAFYKGLHLQGAEKDITSLQGKCSKKREVRGLETRRILSRIWSN